MSVIARTACLGRTQEELQWDLDSLLKLWATVQEELQKNRAPFLIYQESDVIMRSVRDYLRQDIEEIIVDERKTYERVLDLVRNLRPDFAERVRFYHNDIGLFTYHRVESQIETAYQREVKLPSGGAIVIDHTEALTSIDINSSRATKGGDIEETAFQTNREAAREVARQMKLRDLGGLIVIDFIDMENPKNQRTVEDELSEAVKSDRARIQTGKISRFGLLELSRQRLRPSLEESSGMMCPRCSGQGTIRGVESLSLSIIRLIQEEAMRADTLEVHVQLPIPLVTFILNEKRNVISQIETQNKIRVVLIPNANLETPHYQLTKVTQSTDEVTPSYMMQVPVTTETYTTTQVKLKEVEQPAIKSLSIEAAPARASFFKKTLSSLISKISKIFSSAGRNKKDRNGDNRNKGSYGNRRNGGNNGNRGPRGNSRNRNDNRRRTGGAPGTGTRPERNERNDKNDRRPQQNNRPAGSQQPRAPKPAGTADAPPAAKVREFTLSPRETVAPKVENEKIIAKPVILEFNEKAAAPQSAPEIREISPQVRTLLGGDGLNANNANQVQSTNATHSEAKLQREEVVQKTNFAADEVREALRKQHEQSGERVETKVASEAASNPHLNKDIAEL